MLAYVSGSGKLEQYSNAHQRSFYYGHGIPTHKKLHNSLTQWVASTCFSLCDSLLPHKSFQLFMFFTRQSSPGYRAVAWKVSLESQHFPPLERFFGDTEMGRTISQPERGFPTSPTLFIHSHSSINCREGRNVSCQSSARLVKFLHQLKVCIWIN